MTWLLVIVFSVTGGHQAHVFAYMNSQASCDRLAAEMNADKRIPERLAVCVAWKQVT